MSYPKHRVRWKQAICWRIPEREKLKGDDLLSGGLCMTNLFLNHTKQSHFLQIMSKQKLTKQEFSEKSKTTLL